MKRLLALLFLPLSAHAVTMVRSMDVAQTGASTYEVTCNVQFLGVNANHAYTINIGGDTYDLPIFPAPLRIDLGPTIRNVTVSEPGLWTVKASLRKATLAITRIIYVGQKPPIYYMSYCDGLATDNTTATVLGQWQIGDLFQ